MDVPEWKEFELLARQIQQDLDRSAVVTLDEKIVGSSGVEHQCDVVVRQQINGAQFVCVIECKDRAKNVGLGTVRDFASVVDDLAATQGVIIASRGFTPDAEQFARARGLLTYTLIDAQKLKWSEQALIPIVVVDAELAWGEILFHDEVSGQELSVADDAKITPVDQLRLVEKPTGLVLTVGAAILRKWDELTEDAHHMPDEAETFREPGRFDLLSPTRGRVAVIAEFRLSPRIAYHYNWLPLRKGRGFLDRRQRTLITGDEYESVLNFIQARKEWPSVAEAKLLPIRSLETYWMVRSYFRTRPDNPEEIIFGRRRLIPNGRPTSV